MMSNKLKVEKRKAGRPQVDVLKLKKSISLTPDVHDYLLRIGKGNLSGGVALTTEFHKTFFNKVSKESK